MPSSDELNERFAHLNFLQFLCKARWHLTRLWRCFYRGCICHCQLISTQETGTISVTLQCLTPLLPVSDKGQNNWFHQNLHHFIQVKSLQKKPYWWLVHERFCSQDLFSGCESSKPLFSKLMCTLQIPPLHLEIEWCTAAREQLQLI